MSEQVFNEPRIALNRIYTKIGDGGQTRLVGGQSRSKADLRIDCYGTVDELNAFVGAARVTTEEASKQATRLTELATTLKRVQHELFNLGSILATLPEDVHPKQPRVTAAEVARLESEIDSANQDLATTAIVRFARIHTPRCRSSYLPNGVPACRKSSRRTQLNRVRSARGHSVPEPPQRRVLRLEPLDKPGPQHTRNVVGAERGSRRRREARMTDSAEEPVSASDSWSALTAGFLGWTLDAFDFFLVVYCLTAIGREFHQSDSAVSLSLLLTSPSVPLVLSSLG